MNKFENVDVLASLQQIMQQNTAAFQNDFDIDKKILTQAAKSKNAEDKVYLWFSRPNGTHCLRERDVFLRGTREHNTFRFYHEQTKERVLAYAVVLSGMESGKVKGSIYELDYATKAELAIQTALRTDNNRLIYENGSRELPKEYRFEATPDREYGKFVRYEAVPHDPDALRDLLRDESRKRERLKPGNFKEHIGRLSDEKVLAEAQRLSAAFQSLQAPNSPNGTHFVVEVSPWFERIASSKEHERLFALLPYKTLYLSSVKDRHGVFAFISKDERRDLPLRSVDVVLTKPGYGTFTEAACNGAAVLYLRRDDWPEQDCLIEWLETNARCLELGEVDLASPRLPALLEALWRKPMRTVPIASGAAEVAELIGQRLRTIGTGLG